MKKKILVVLIGLFTLGQTLIHAQDSGKTEVRKVIDMLFDGMREGDSSKVRSVFRPEARMYTSFISKSGDRILQHGNLQDFLHAIGTPHKDMYDERISNTLIQIDGGIAQVWTDYSFYLGDTFSHCGVDAFQLVLEHPGEWRILHLMDTRRKEGCEKVFK